MEEGTGAVIRTFPSATAAALHHGLSRNAVSTAISSRGGVVAGLHFRYA